MFQPIIREQIVVGLDVCEKVVFRKAHYDRLVRTLARSDQLKMLRSTFPAWQFEKDPEFTFFIWDVIVAAIIIDPSVITKEVTAFVDINDQFGLSYGQSMAYPQLGPEGSLKARIILDVNQDKLWDMINDKTYWKSAQ